MFKKFDNSLSQNPDDLASTKAKAIYFALLSVAMEIIRDIIELTKEYCESEEAKELKIEFPDENAFKNFLGHEIGVILCLFSTKEGYERFFIHKREREVFTATLFDLFKNYLKIPWGDFCFYLDGGERLKNTDKLDIIYMKLFVSRIVAYLLADAELYNFDWKDNTKFCPRYYLQYSFLAEAVLVYGTLFTRVFETVMKTLKMYASEDADIAQVIELSKKLDEYIIKKEQEQIHVFIMDKLSKSLRRYSASVARLIDDLDRNPSKGPVKNTLKNSVRMELIKMSYHGVKESLV
jgi:hypothetical protein